ncbi:hypothetical protein PAECIP111893_01915 [Paenibacillus plantiphilus]|uniref:AIM24 family protein n=1 Tax=Paenibacillus plantiphilus TaxID=2905650 RepID=A0ABN8GF37_9BACL|nr:AIM24 family protein [Paenibacillus plantiphilus]CAH1202750.1 hypothetical protein PAECIP111893_01915 [Paenibacillus plantiphilus]
MDVKVPTPLGHVRVSLDNEDTLHVLHPKSILAYQGAPQSREDRFMDLAGAYRKRKWIRSKLVGQSEFILGLPPGCQLESVAIGPKSDLMFDFRHVMFYTDGLHMKSKIQKIKTAWITQDWIRMKFTGPGTLGIITTGDLITMQLHPSIPLYVEAGSLIAYPDSARIKLAVYGNQLASQHMNVQWEMTGSGPVLIQSGSRDAGLMEQLQGGGIVKRVLRELLPFGSIYIK